MEKIWQKNVGAEKFLEFDCEVSQLQRMRLCVGTGGAESTAGVSRGARSPRMQSFTSPLCRGCALAGDMAESQIQALSFCILFGAAFHCSLILSSEE